jgi:hypothetical protein
LRVGSIYRLLAEEGDRLFPTGYLGMLLALCASYRSVGGSLGSVADPRVSDDLDRGAIVSLVPTRLAVREFPIR